MADALPPNSLIASATKGIETESLHFMSEVAREVLPPHRFVAVSGPLVPRVRRSRFAGAFLDGVVVASLALMGIVTVQLGHAAFVDAWTIGLACASAIALIRFRVSSVWLVLAGAVFGLLAG